MRNSSILLVVKSIPPVYLKDTNKSSTKANLFDLLLIRCLFGGRKEVAKDFAFALGNGSALQGTPVFLRNFTTKIVVFRGVSRKDGFGGDDIVFYSMFRFVFHGFK